MYDIIVCRVYHKQMKPLPCVLHAIIMWRVDLKMPPMVLLVCIYYKCTYNIHASECNCFTGDAFTNRLWQCLVY